MPDYSYFMDDYYCWENQPLVHQYHSTIATYLFSQHSITAFVSEQKLYSMVFDYYWGSQLWVRLFNSTIPIYPFASVD